MHTLIKIFLIITITNLYAKPLEKITLQLQWKHQFEFAGFYAAKEKGFYEDVGLDVNFLEYSANTSITDEVLKGKAEYGLTYASIIAEYINGKPLVYLANFFKQSPLVLITQKEIKTLTQLNGKKVMGVSDTIDNITLLLMLDKFGVSTNDIINVPTTFTTDDFINKKVDAMAVFTTNELFELNKKGVEYNMFDPTVYGAKYYDANLFTTNSELKNHPDRVKNFKEASIKGWEYALNNKAEIVELILEKYNTQNKSKDALNFEAAQVEYIMLPNVYEIGSIDINRVQSIANSFIQSGFIDNTKSNLHLNSLIYDSKNSNIYLSADEKKYLAEKKKLTMCINPDWMPFESFKKDKHIGISSDYFAIIEKYIGIPIEALKTDTWSESLELAKDKKCDILSFVMQTPNQKEYLNFTTPYINIPLVLATKNSVPFISDFTTLANKKIGISKGYAYRDILRKKYPYLNIIDVQNIKDGLQKVNNGEFFGFIGTLSGIGYLFQKEFTGNLKITGKFDETLDIGIGVRNDDETLLSILEKSINLIDESQKQSIMNRWVAIKYESATDYELLFKIFGIITVLILIIFYRHYLIKKSNTKLKIKMQEESEKSRDKDKMIFHQSKLISMGEMIENIAHQWRQPLSQINSAVLIIDDVMHEKKFQNSEIEEKLLEIESLTKYMSKTINDFKDFFDKNKKIEHFSLRELVEKSIYIIKGTYKSHNIEIESKIDKEYLLHGYQSELQQVIVVILNNAKDMFLIRNIFKPKVTVTISQDEDYYKLSICDNAGGIDSTIIEKVFEPYFTTKHKSQGTGLGLFISKKIIEDNMDGKLEVQNHKNGVCFNIILKVNNAR